MFNEKEILGNRMKCVFIEDGGKLVNVFKYWMDDVKNEKKYEFIVN